MFKLRINDLFRSVSDYVKKRMDSVSVGRRKVLLIVFFVVALIFLIGQTVVAFMKIDNNI